MRIAMLSRGLDLSFGRHINPLIRELRTLGVDVDLLNAEGNIKAIFKVKSKKVKDADIVHYQGSPYNFLPTTKPTVVTVHTLLEDELKYSKKMMFRIGMLFEKRSLAHADTIITVNSVMNKRIREFSSVPIYTIPNGIDIEETFSRSLTPSGLLSGGRLVPRKNFQFLLEVMKKRQLLDVPLTIFGDGPLRQSLVSQSSDNVELVGFVSRERLLQLYSTSLAFVCTSLYESDPFTILDAMANKCPVVCGDHAWAEQAILNRETGLLFYSSSRESLRDTILTLIENFALCNIIAEKAYNFVKTERNWTDIAKRTIKVYEEVLA